MATITSTGAVNQSITRVGRYEPFNLQLARGQISLHSQVNVFGYQAAVGTTAVPVWENATAYVYPSTAVVMTLVSSSASDNAISVLISGLDASYNPISETVALNGTTGVNTVNSYFRINSLSLTTGTNIGTITAKNGGTTYAAINPGIGKSQNSWYTVPAGNTFYLNRVQISSNLSYAGSVYNYYQVYAKTSSGLVLVVLQQPFVSTFNVERQTPFPYAAGTDLQFQVSTSTGTSAVGIVVEGFLIQNDGTL